MISGVISSSSVPRLQHPQVARAQDAEPAVEIRLAMHWPSTTVVAHAEEGEIVGQQPLQELNRFGDLVDRQRRRIGLELGDIRVDALEHRAPVVHGEPHVAEHGLQRARRVRRARVIGDRLEMNMDEALARAFGGVGCSECD